MNLLTCIDKNGGLWLITDTLPYTQPESTLTFLHIS